jgi:HlyD family secretion protein
MADKSRLFREAALEELASPEQLDLAMRVTSPVGWLALAASGLFLLVALAWSVFGRVSDTVTGQGILIRGEAVRAVVSGTSGRLLEMTVRVRDEVKAGQVVATVAQPDLLLNIENTRAALEDQLQRHTSLTEAEERNRQRAVRALNEERASLDSLDIVRRNTEEALRALQEERESVLASIGDFEEQAEALAGQVAGHEELVREGIMARSQLLGSKEQLAAVRQSISRSQVRLAQIRSEETAQRRELQQTQATIEVRLAQIGSEETSLERQLQLQRSDRLSQIEELRRRLRDLESTLETKSRIVSPYQGKVLELSADPGNVVTQGSRVLTLEAETEALEAVLYVPAGQGKRVLKDMTVRISPSTVRVEEYGFMLGEVKSVSEFPVTPEGVQRVLRNDNLVRNLTAEAPPIEVVAKLLEDPNTTSGYKWSSSSGPPSGVFSGTLCQAKIVVQQRRPISYVFPIFRRAVGAY